MGCIPTMQSFHFDNGAMESLHQLHICKVLIQTRRAKRRAIMGPISSNKLDSSASSIWLDLNLGSVRPMGIVVNYQGFFDSAPGQKGLQEDLYSLSSPKLPLNSLNCSNTGRGKQRTLNPFCKFYLIKIDSNKVAISDYNLSLISVLFWCGLLALLAFVGPY